MPKTKSGGFSTNAIQSVSNTCNPSGGYRYYETRLDACADYTTYIQSQEVPSGRILGTVNYDVLNYLYTSVNSITWANQLQIIEDSRSGDMNGLAVSGQASCSGACTLRSTSFPSQFLRQGVFNNGEAYFDGTSVNPGNRGALAGSKWNFSFTKPGWAYPDNEVLDATALHVRCDNAIPGNTNAGCVFPDYFPTVIYSRTGPYPELAQHIGDAQQSGLPGAYPGVGHPGEAFPVGNPLSRLFTGDDSQDNRDAACLDRYVRPTGKNCDEYPFATSQQGAALSGGPGRSFSYCSIPSLPARTGPDGYSACMINDKQNFGGGGVLSGVYRSNRVMEGDKFYVWIQP